jgi:RNA polymerase sigma factor (sigma-70 family)
MSQDDWVTEQFEANRAHLRTVAFRMLGSLSDADDAVQEAWLRLDRADPAEVRNLGGWLTTVVSRVCLDILRSRESRREEAIDRLDTWPAAAAVILDRPVRPGDAPDPEQEAMAADAVGAALLVVLETLTPAERLAFILHDMFGVTFEEIAVIVDRSPAAARQLASRGRRRVQGAAAPPDPDLGRQRRVVDAFLAASREGDFAALLELLDPDVVLRGDPTAVATGTPGEVLGAHAVASTFCGRAKGARAAFIDGAVGAVWAPGGRPRVVFDFVIEDGRVVEIEMLADPVSLARMDLQILPGAPLGET